MQLWPLLLAEELASLLDGPRVVVHVHRPDRLIQLHVADRVHLIVHIHVGQTASLLGRCRCLMLLLPHHLPDATDTHARPDLALLREPMQSLRGLPCPAHGRCN